MRSIKIQPLLVRPCLRAAFGCLVIISLGSPAATFEVVGQLRTVIYADGSIVHSRTNAFKASVDGCRFHVRTEAPGLGSLYAEFARVEDFSVDFLKNDVALMKSAPSVDEWGFERRPQPNPGEIPEAYFNVNPTVVPPDSTATLPWLAYASSCYLLRITNGTIQSPLVQDFTKARTKYWLAPKAPAQWRFSRTTPSFLELLVVFRDGQALGLPEPFSGRITNCVYEVLQWTNVAGISLPLDFKLTRYAPDLTAKDSPRLLVDGLFRGQVSGVSPRLSITNFLPILSTNTQVADRRFEDEDAEHAIVYMAKEGQILTYEELKKEPRFRAFMRR
jgi:hypothetical protein